jgi:hypothetical protein
LTPLTAASIVRVVGNFGAAAVCLAGFGLIGCSQAVPSLEASAASATAVEPTATIEPAVSQEPRTLTFDLEPMGNETEAHGTVVVDISGDGYTMTITAENLDSNGQYPINLHSGACPNPELSEATAVWIVQQAPADDSGTLVYEKEFEGLWEIPDGGRTLTIHGRVPNDARTHIACADLTE